MIRSVLALAAGVSLLAVASAANAADLIINEPAAPGYVETSGNWDGPYIGAFVGAGWATAYDQDGDEVTDVNGVGALNGFNGWLVGGTVGANFTLGSGIVAGVVADAAWTDITATAGTDDLEVASVDWQGSLRGRIGLDGGAFLPYLTAGLAVAGGTLTVPDSSTTTVSASATHIGWTVGAGIEMKVTEDLSIDALYRYSDYGSQNYDLSPVDSTVEGSFTSHTVQVGLNWHF